MLDVCVRAVSEEPDDVYRRRPSIGRVLLRGEHSQSLAYVFLMQPLDRKRLVDNPVEPFYDYRGTSPKCRYSDFAEGIRQALASDRQ